MYGIFTYISRKNQPNVGEYTMHGSLGILSYDKSNMFFLNLSRATG